MGDINIEVTGLAELVKKFESLGEQALPKAAKRAVREAGGIVEETIVAHAPRHSGFMAEHFNLSVRQLADYVRARIFPNAKAIYPK